MSKSKATQRINEQMEKTRHKKTLSPILFILPVVFIIIAVGIFLIMSEEDKIPANVVVTPDNVKEVIENLDDTEKTDAGSFEVDMTINWTFENGTSVSKDASIKNVVNNTNIVYVTISHPDTGEEIYKSPHIPVGSTLKNIKLDKDLDSGKYKAPLTYHLLDNSYNELSTTSLYVTINILN
ncbi:MAG: hypothetical protein IJD58_08635 [Lachnospiraceae bacterium]|nr:hypothetical protein [Lachnospiraceae bacterium]